MKGGADHWGASGTAELQTILSPFYFLSFKMISVLSGFADADSWAYRADGEIVGRASNDSYAQKVRAGLPAYVLVADPTTAPPVETCVVSAAAAAAEAPKVLSALSYEDDKYADWDFDRFFAPVESRAAARARRHRSAKPPKYGPKPTKRRTAADSPAADDVLPKAAEAVPNCAVLKPIVSDNKCSCCGLVQDVAEYCYCLIATVRACHHCRAAFAVALASAQEQARAYNAYLEELGEEIRAEQRMRDARYRD